MAGHPPTSGLTTSSCEGAEGSKLDTPQTTATPHDLPSLLNLDVRQALCVASCQRGSGSEVPSPLTPPNPNPKPAPCSFHHIEFYCGDATNTCRRFQLGLGMNLVSKSDLSTGNNRFASYCLKSHDLMFVFTAPYSTDSVPPGGVGGNKADPTGQETHPGFEAGHASDFFRKHGMAVRAIGEGRGLAGSSPSPDWGRTPLP